MKWFKTPGPYPYVLCLFIALLPAHWTYSQQNLTQQKPTPQYIQQLIDMKLLQAVPRTKVAAKGNVTMMAATSAPGGHAGTLEAKLPLVVQPSPNSATLTRLINDNVDLYTGRLNVNVPMYTLKSRDLELPISLQAAANAHKVNDIGSWVGLGWSLQAGGSITRVMKNLPDEFTGTINSQDYNFQGYGYTKLKQSVNVDVSLFEGNTYDINKKRDIIDKGNWNVSNNQPNSGYDLQPDEFYFNFGKHSGKFVFDQDGKIHTISKSNLTITPTYEVREGNNKISTFTVLTDDGYRYHFGNFSSNAVEETKLYSETRSTRFYYEAAYDIYGNYAQDPATGRYVYLRSPTVFTLTNPPATPANDNFTKNIDSSNFFFYPSTWHLTSILSPTGDLITLNYADNGTITYWAERSFSGSMPMFDEIVANNELWYLSGIEPTRSVAWFYDHYPSPQTVSVNKSRITLRSKRLQSIVAAQTNTVSFISNNWREDLPGDRRLDKIVVTNSNNIVLKEFNFTYDIRQSNEPPENLRFSFYETRFKYNQQGIYSGYDYGAIGTEDWAFDVADYQRKRMFLRSVTETGGGISLPPYKFDYNTTALPYRTSTQQDFYGYFNGNTSRHPFVGMSYRINNHNVPGYTAYGLFPFYITNGTGGGANKSASAEHMKAGTLTKITYPTGGYKDFEFEFNGGTIAWNGLRVKTIKEYAAPSTTPITKEYSYGTFHATDQALLNHSMQESNNGIWVDHRIFFNSDRSNPENLTNGTAGGYDYAEIKQPGNGRHRVEFAHPTETDFNNEKTMVKIVSVLLNPNVQDLSVSRSPFPSPTSFDWRRGQPLEEYTYDNNNKLLKQVSYRYDYTTINPQNKLIDGMAVTKVRFNFSTGSWNQFLYGKYSHYSNWLALASKTEKTFAADGVHYLETKEEYTQRKQQLNNQEYMHIDEVKISKPGKNEQLVHKFKYISDYAIGSPSDEFKLGIQNLGLRNVFNAPVENIQYLQHTDGTNKRIIGGAVNKYHASKPFVKQSYTLQVAAPLTSFTESNTNSGSFSMDVNYKPVNNFEYGTRGNIVQQYKEGDAKQSFIWDYNNVHPIAKVNNAALSDIAYTSFEDEGNGGWTINSPSRVNEGTTGKRSYSIGLGASKSGLDPAKTYVISYWANPFANVTVNNEQSSITGPTINGWTYYEKTVTGISTLTVNGGGLVDELRLFPKNAQMTTYVYEPLVGITTEIDANNRMQRYEYDGLQRLTAVKDEKGNIVKTYEYNHRSDNTMPMWSATSDKRCEPCAGNGNYHTYNQEVKQVDVNPYSPTYKSERWFNTGYSAECTVQADWQNVSGPACLKNANGFNTGIQRYVQRDMNPCSNTYNTTRNYDEVNYGNCPSNEPNWTATEEIRCRPCSNPSYVSKWQERKFVDQNPNSSTYNTIQWRETGSFCTVPGDWQSTGSVPQCELSGYGGNTGYLLREKRDLNPCSNTYNQIIWDRTYDITSCPQVTFDIIYNDWKNNGSGITADIYIKFKQWVNGAWVDFHVNNISFTMLEDHQSNNCEQFTLQRQFSGKSGTLIKLYDDEVVEYELPECYTYITFMPQF